MRPYCSQQQDSHEAGTSNLAQISGTSNQRFEAQEKIIDQPQYHHSRWQIAAAGQKSGIAAVQRRVCERPKDDVLDRSRTTVDAEQRKPGNPDRVRKKERPECRF